MEWRRDYLSTLDNDFRIGQPSIRALMAVSFNVKEDSRMIQREFVVCQRAIGETFDDNRLEYSVGEISALTTDRFPLRHLWGAGGRLADIKGLTKLDFAF